jgi:hypothetical protein
MLHSGADAVFLLLVKAANRELVQRLVTGGVEFVVVGSTALAFHGLRDPALVGDLDLLVNNTPENAERVGRALASAGVPLSVAAERLTQTKAQVQLKGQTRYFADILTSSAQLSYTVVRDQAAKATQGQLTLLIASREHLIQMKE